MFVHNEADSPSAFRPIVPSRDDETVTLTGTHLTVDQIVAVAVHGARVRYAPDAVARSTRQMGLVLEAARQGKAIYWVTRGTGKDRKVTTFAADPFSDAGRHELLDVQLRTFRGESPSLAVRARGPEVADEATVRAVLVVAANVLTRRGASEGLLHAVADLLNHRVAPVLPGRGSPGQGDLPQLSLVAQTLVGVGEAHLRGQRMPAARALAEAGLAPLAPFGIDSGALIANNAFGDGQAALLVAEAETLLHWADLVHVIGKLALNDTVTPLLAVLRAEESDAHQLWLARRLDRLTRGSSLWDADPQRTLQGPLSFRDYVVLGGVAWRAWERLAREVERAVNTPGQNPAILPDLGPGDSWQLGSGALRPFHTEGDGGSGFIVANPGYERRGLDQEVGGLAEALSHVAVASFQRRLRLQEPFVNPLADPATLPSALGASRAQEGDYPAQDLWSALEAQLRPPSAMQPALIRGLEDLSSNAHRRTARVRDGVATALDLVAQEGADALLWLEVRALAVPGLKTGPAVAALLAACAPHVPLAGFYPDIPPVAVSLRRFMGTVDPRAFLGEGVEQRPAR